MIRCCGPDPCQDFEAWFCQVKKLLPQWIEGTICKNGVYEKLILARAKTFYQNVYEDNLCKFSYESDPLTSCELLECHAKSMGILDECVNVCGIDPVEYPNEYKIGLTAKTRFKKYLEYNSTPNAAMFFKLAELLGLEIEIKAPTLHGEKVLVPNNCEIVGDFETECDTTNCREIPGYGLPIGAPVSDCQGIERKVAFVIKCAPPSLNLTDTCTGDVSTCNPFVETFKCMVRKLKPVRVKIVFCDEYLKNAPCALPTYLDDCE